MNATLSLPRTDLKENRPIIEKLEVPVLKRSRFLGVGGLNLKKLMAETGKHAVCHVLYLSVLDVVTGNFSNNSYLRLVVITSRQRETGCQVLFSPCK